MTAFIIVLIFSGAGIGYVLWTMKNDPSLGDSIVEELQPKEISDELSSTADIKKSDSQEKTDESSSKFKMTKLFKKEEKNKPKKQDDRKEKKSLFDFLKKIKFGKKKTKNEEIQPFELTSISSLDDNLKFSKNVKEADQKPVSLEETGTASLRTAPAEEIEQPAENISENKAEGIDAEAPAEIDLSSTDTNDLNEKYKRLEDLFKEKSNELEIARTSLENELNNRKGFNTVKELLENEITELKDKIKKLQLELDTMKAENENNKKRAQELEENESNLNKTLDDKQKELEDMQKSLKTFGTPKKEEEKKPKTTEETPQIEKAEIDNSSKEDQSSLEQTAEQKEEQMPQDIAPKQEERIDSSLPENEQNSETDESLTLKSYYDNPSDISSEEKTQDTQDEAQEPTLDLTSIEDSAKAEDEEENNEDNDREYLKLPPDPFTSDESSDDTLDLRNKDDENNENQEEKEKE